MTTTNQKNIANNSTQNLHKTIFIVALLLCISLTILTLAPTANASIAVNLKLAKSAIMIEQSSGRILLEHNAHQQLPMASTTKIVTALTVLANCKDIDQQVHIDDKAVGVEGSSIYLTYGEVLTVRQLLYGLMLRSGNDSAVALAIHVGGSVDNFANLMNEQAQKLGLINTHFVNPNGLPDDRHYTTAYELALLTKEAFNYPAFQEIVSSKSYKFVSPSGKQYNFYNENKLLNRIDGADGVKTGFTKKAGRCFVGSCTQNGMRLIAVVLNCGPMFELCQSMLEFGQSHYTITNIVPYNKLCGAQFDGKTAKYYYCKKSFSYPIANNSDDLSRISKVITLPNNANEYGKIEVYLDKQLIFCQKLVTI